ncbi:MAG: ClpXP protease specificity-enhancing factor [Nitrosomonas sp.]|nr:MAG: ClpXP protease specificity-enhancing factor [Nitrosomonas sp.]
MIVQSTKPYLIRSIYEWCIDSGLTPYLSVRSSDKLNLPKEYIKNGEIIFNVSAHAIQDLVIANNEISFMARFGGVSRKIEIPIILVQSIFAKEINQGIAFTLNNKMIDYKHNEIKEGIGEVDDASKAKESSKSKKPGLRIIK